MRKFNSGKITFEYPESWIISDYYIWNELYVLRAFLQNNPRYSIQFFQDMLQYKHKDIFEKNWPKSLPAYNNLPYPASLWIRKEA